MNQRVAWTDEEISHLREHHKEMSYRQIGENLGRSTHGVTTKANKLGLSRNWSEQELDYLRQHYANQPTKETITVLGKSKSSVIQKAMELGLTRKQAVQEPSAANDAKKMGTVHHQPSRYRAEWTEEDVKYMTENLVVKGYQAVADHLGRTPESVRFYAREKGLTISQLKMINGDSRQYPETVRERWTRVDLQTVNDMHFKGFSWYEIGVILDRTPEACRYQYKLLKSGKGQFTLMSNVDSCAGFVIANQNY